MKKYSITEDTSCTPCKHTEDGYCLRKEGDYCKNGECHCPHWITELKVIQSCVTCETTVEVCEACQKTITEPITEC